MGYLRETIKGISWGGALRGSTRIVALIRTVILARILTPTQFGVFGIAALILTFVEIITETGINVFLVQEKGRINKYISTAWIVSIVRGFLITVLVAASAPLVVGFFNAPDVLPLVLLISLIPFIRGFINPSIVKFQKDLLFGREFWFRLTIFTIDSTVAIVLAFLTREASSLILGLLAGALLEVALSFLVIRPRPTFDFRLNLAKKVFRRGKWVTLAGVFEYLFGNIDDIVVAKFLNTSFLGLYQMAYKIAELPITEVAVVVSRVTFPVYTKISDDLTRLKSAFSKTMLGTLVLIVPLGLILILFPYEVIKILLGPGWLEAAPVLRILAVFGILRAMSGSIFALFLAVRKQEFVTLVTFFNILGLAITVVPLVIKFGMIGAGMAAIIGSLGGLLVALFLLWKILKTEEFKQ